MTVYFISGLGADNRMFENLDLPLFINIKHIPWLEPLENESLENYAKRMLAGIDPYSHFCLVGLSFGGLVAIEINKLIQAKRVFIISSITHKREIPSVSSIANILKLHKITPAALLKTPNSIIYWFFGIKTRRDKDLLNNYIKNMSSNYLKWSIDKILNWQNNERPDNVYHIHGSDDKIFPIRNLNADVVIHGGGHFMIHNKFEEINNVLAVQLLEYKII